MKSKNICKDLTFSDCELAILRMSVDKAQEKMAKRVVNSDDIKNIINVVENFIKKKNLICYGGTAINNILPSEDQFYNKDLEIPNSTITRDTRTLSENSGNLYESVAIISKRANQISVDLKRELHSKLDEFAITGEAVEEVQENKVKS